MENERNRDKKDENEISDQNEDKKDEKEISDQNEDKNDENEISDQNEEPFKDEDLPEDLTELIETRALRQFTGMDGAVSAIRKWQRHMDQILGPVRASFEPLNAFSETYQRAVEPLRKMSELLEPYNHLLGSTYELMRLARDPIMASVGAVSEISRIPYLMELNLLKGSPISKGFKLDEDLLEYLKQKFREQQGEEVNHIDADLIEAEIKQIDVVENDTISEYKLHNAIEHMKKKHPILRVIILYVIIWQIQYYFTPFMPPQDALKNAVIGRTSNQVVKIVREELKPQSDLEMFAFSVTRIVRTNELVVRNRDDHKAMRIAVLRLGQTVRLVDKRKDFSYVQFIDETTKERREGWVYSRYLVKVMK
ncbi:hypothetical protein RB620_24610 [Paenibacillus sp. LHD-117]|uniref:hypothetical protein n=1 Tax=Paenibacillus sp. LHD-117 TaxID=3071412 RepID=UPI0027E0DE65|nr:hypothetical protein [Paenibacillus sp. LHD-117]MDQ6422619.1 hypothetical protein [Paenibacillus sp. LHD-117]